MRDGGGDEATGGVPFDVRAHEVLRLSDRLRLVDVDPLQVAGGALEVCEEADRADGRPPKRAARFLGQGGDEGDAAVVLTAHRVKGHVCPLRAGDAVDDAVTQTCVKRGEEEKEREAERRRRVRGGRMRGVSE